MATELELELEARPGKVVLQLTTEDGTFRYPLSADGADRLAEQVATAAERASELGQGDV